MKKISTYLLLLFFLKLSTISWANVSGVVQGLVIDEADGQPLEFVTVAIYNAPDQSLVTGTVSDEQGKFEIKGLPVGEYYLEVTYIGYDKASVNDININSRRTHIELKDIILPRAASQLDEVEIVAEELGVEYKIDRKVINVSQQLTAASGTAVDILENIPSITVDVDGNVALRGSTGFMVLIDGIPSVLDPSEALQQIPSTSIENIEIITNPSAKYNPDGTAGIINVITKKDRLKGLSGTADVNAGTFGRFGVGLLATYTKKKWSVFLGGDYNQGERPGFSSSDRVTTKNDTTYFTRSEGDRNRNRDFWAIRGGFNYLFSENDLFNVEFNYGYRSGESYADQNYEEWIEPGSSAISRYLSQETSFRGGNFYSINATFKHDFQTPGHNLSAGISYRSREGEDTSTNQLLDSAGNISNGQINMEDGPGRVLQLNLDYVLPIGEANKFEAGYQSRMGRSTDLTELYIYNEATGEFDKQPEFSNETDYLRDIHALYAIYGGEKGKLGYQVGIRGEYTYRVIESAKIENKSYIDRLDYFPSVHFSYKLPAEQQIMASYSRRIERPRSWYLEPFITWEDAFNVRQGNPGLKPEYIDAMEVAYLIGFGEHSLSFEGYYRITNNKVERIQSVYAENVMLSRPENVGQDFALGGEMALGLSLFKWWKMDLSGNFYQYRLEGEYEEIIFERESFNWNTRLSNTFRFGEGTRIQLNSRYNSATVTAQGTRGDFWTADIAVSQEFFKKRMSAILQVRDMFGKVVRDQESMGSDFMSRSEYYNKAPQVRVTVNYRFNNYKKKRNGGGGDDDEF
ncbi:MAG: TonB-dependent receptor [Cyclobacteriaceae bacterium]|jgi:outer membrane receptor protein involved in Fe transport